MLPAIDSLLAIQERDTRLQELRLQLERIPKEQDQARERLAQHEQEVARAKLAIQENEVAIKNLELDIGTRKETISRLQKQQFETRKNEEYAALGTEVVRYTSEVDELETKELELMENGDRLAGIQKEAKAAYDTTHAGVENEIKALEERATAFKAEAEGLEAERAELTGKADPDTLSLYERLLARRGAPVVVGISDSRQCTGCHVRATPATMVHVNGGKVLAQCENCGRILYPE